MARWRGADAGGIWRPGAIWRIGVVCSPPPAIGRVFMQRLIVGIGSGAAESSGGHACALAARRGCDGSMSGLDMARRNAG
jgi:hypothetical protein